MPQSLAINVGFAGSPAEREQLIQRVRVAEDLGVHSAWVAEAWGRDAFTFLTELALKTSKIKLGTAIVNVFSRSPAVLAMTAAGIDELSGGRVILGLGSSGANVIEHWHGVHFQKPLTRLKEYVEIINKIMRRQRLTYDGEIFQLRRGFIMQFAPVRDHIPIFIAAITPKSIRQIGEVADGWIPIYWPLERFQDGISLVTEGANAKGRTREDITVAPALGVFVTDGNEEAARRAARQPIAFYVGRMGVFYYQMLQRNGFEKEVEAIRAAWEKRDAEGAAAAVSDRMLESTTIVGSVDECRDKIQARVRAGINLPLINLPGSDPAETGRI